MPRPESFAGHLLPEIRRFFRSTSAKLGIAVVILLVLFAAFSPLVAPMDPIDYNPDYRLQPPGSRDGAGHVYLLGTDQLGRDVLSRLVYGSRISVLIMATVVPMSAMIGVTLGLVAGYYGGSVDNVIMRVVDIRLALPFILVLLAVMAILGPSLRNTILVLGLLGFSDYARFVRAETLSVRQLEFVTAAKASGASDFRLIVRHVLPNVLSTIIVIATLQIPHVIVTEASLSFLGLGIKPPTPSWGGMVGEGRQYIYTAWWLSSFPGLAIALTVLGGNLLGDRLRDVLDPKLRTLPQ